MFWPVLIFLLAAALAIYGALLLHYACGRRERPEGWEDRRVAESGDAVWQAAWRAGREWLARQETEELEAQSEDGFLLHALLIPHIAPRATVLLFHGWRSSWEMDFLCILPFLHSLGLQCLLVDERAQGDSEGRYMTFGVRERLDVPVWVDYAAGRFGKEHPLFLHGLSMGAATVLMASDTRFGGNVRGIVADCGFATPYDAVCAAWREKTPLPAHASVWLLDRYARRFADFSFRGRGALGAVREARYPVLFIHGTDDKFVPSCMTEQLYEACASDKELLLVEGAGHCMSCLVDRARYEAAYREFVQKHLLN